MFGEYVFNKSPAKYVDKILLFDDHDLDIKTNYTDTFFAYGFEIIKYIDDLSFRIEYEEKLKYPGKKIVIIAYSNQYIPYDLYSRLSVYTVSLENLFPKLNFYILKNMDKIGLDLLSMVYLTNFDDLRKKQDTESFLSMKVYNRINVKLYLEEKVSALIKNAENAVRYNDWFIIAEKKAELDIMAVKYDINIETCKINKIFQQYVIEHFGKLSQYIDRASPVLVSKVIDYIYANSDNFIIIIMDGMSEFDWKIISESFGSLQYDKTSIFAMIPSTTSISRQCLLSGKYPIQLLEPWKLSKEKSEFISCAKSIGYSEAQIGYERGYDVKFTSVVRCGAIIINDVDDMVHAQKQGKLGMLNDITVLRNQKKLFDLTQRLLDDGYDIYITSDHGNTVCTGLGKLMGTGVEVETKSRRMVVLKDFADKIKMIEKYGLIEYPKYYLPKEYDYLICDIGNSFDNSGANVITHGGITLDEVIVPFIKIKAVHKNG